PSGLSFRAAQRSQAQRRLVALLVNDCGQETVEANLRGLADSNRSLSRQITELLHLIRQYGPEAVNALGRKPSCSLQDSACGAAGLADSGLGDFARRILGAGTGGDNRYRGSAISAGCPGRLGGTRHR